LLNCGGWRCFSDYSDFDESGGLRGADDCSNGVFFLSAWADIQGDIYPLNRMSEMFFPPNRQTIIAVFVVVTTMAISTQAMAWQSAEFERRAAAMARARARSNQPMVVSASAEQAVKVQKTKQTMKSATGVAKRNPNPRPNERVAAAIVTTPRSVGAPRKPARVAQMIHGGSPIMGGSVVQGDIVGSTYAGGEIISGDPIYEEVIHDSVIYDEGYSVTDCGCGAGSTGYQCGIGTAIDGGCCGRGGCPPGGPCWLGNIGKALRTGEYFGGATAFQSPLFTEPGQSDPVNENNLASDSSFGFYGGFNLGIPLCRLSCGYLSGQFGIRSVNTNFNGNEFTSEERRQTFVTAGLYRRVDYGLQFGAVADILHEEWFTESDLVQIRADLGWVYQGGHTVGFRYATGVQDDITEGAFNGDQFSDFFQTTDDNYRFYYRHMAPWGGWGEAFVGWGEAAQTIIGVDVDLPVTDYISFQSGFSAYLNDDLVPATGNFQGGNLNEAWNLFVGISFKPQGRSWYRSYDRPLFSVADNGTMLVRRQSPEIN
jgi:hypothetical protein